MLSYFHTKHAFNGEIMSAVLEQLSMTSHDRGALAKMVMALLDHWKLTTSPTASPVEIRIVLSGWWYGHGELINQ